MDNKTIIIFLCDGKEIGRINKTDKDYYKYCNIVEKVYRRSGKIVDIKELKK